MIQSGEMEDFLTKGYPKLLRFAVASENKEGGCMPHVSSVWYLWDAGSFWISTSEDRLKVKCIRENPNVALIVDTDTIPYEGVIVEGTATLTKRDVRRKTLEIVKRYVRGEKNIKTQYADLMKYPRILISIKPKKLLDIMSYKKWS